MLKKRKQIESLGSLRNRELVELKALTRDGAYGSVIGRRAGQDLVTVINLQPSFLLDFWFEN